MSFEAAKKHLENRGLGDKIKEFTISSATVELAAKALSTAPAHIAKSITFTVDNGPIMVVCAGDAKVNNSKFKAQFNTKAKMLTAEQVENLIGHQVGGVCPFGVKDGVKIFLDESLKRFEVVYPACGNNKSAVALTIAELESSCDYVEWVDVCNIR